MKAMGNMKLRTKLIVIGVLLTAIPLFMDKVVQRNAASAEETASASQQLDAQTEGLKELVSTILGLIGGAKEGRIQCHTVETRPEVTYSAHAERPQTALIPSRHNGNRQPPPPCPKMRPSLNLLPGILEGNGEARITVQRSQGLDYGDRKAISHLSCSESGGMNEKATNRVL
jgi:hypothetical protein